MSQRREYGAEVEASPLITWLNDASPDDRSRGRVLQIRTLLLELELIVSELRPYLRNHPLAGDKKYPKLTWESIDVTNRLNGLLGKYRLTPKIEARISKRWSFLLLWRAVKSRRGFVARVHDIPGVPELYREFDEAQAVQGILALSRAGYLANLKPCEECKQWFYAIRFDGKFCGENCRQKHFRGSEEFREKRKRYMKVLRKRHEEMARKQKVTRL